MGDESRVRSSPVTGRVPDPDGAGSESDRRSVERALEYMGLAPGTRIEDVSVDRVFIGSCTNARLEDLRAAAGVVRGHKVSGRVRAMVVPGSQAVKRAAEAEGLDEIFREAGFRVARGGLLDVSGDEPGHARPGRALRLDQQP